MEREIKIKMSDKHLIYGVENYLNRTDKLIIFVHGLTGHKNEHLFFNASRFFTRHGFATFRFNLYSGEEKGRNLEDCTIKTHANDLDLVIKYFRQKYKNIYLVGHSLGGPTILNSSQKGIKSIVLWDPSLDNTMMEENIYEFNPLLNKYIIHWGVSSLMSKEMVKEWKTVDNNLFDKFVVPTKIICAEKGILIKDWKKIIPLLKIKHDFALIKNATHCFDEWGTEEKLFEETLKWIK